MVTDIAVSKSFMLRDSIVAASGTQVRVAFLESFRLGHDLLPSSSLPT
jgi:hypothetical protein